MISSKTALDEEYMIPSVFSWLYTQPRNVYYHVHLALS